MSMEMSPTNPEADTAQADNAQPEAEMELDQPAESTPDPAASDPAASDPSSDPQPTEPAATESDAPAPVITNKTKTEQEEPTRTVTVLSELDKYWSAVRENPGDFTGWTYLLQYVEQENKLDDARPAYQEFLGRYPYCYGYWKKFADLEKKNSNLKECEEVFEKGLQAIPLSQDLWTHYLNFTQDRYADDLDRDAKIRALYERALVACGVDFHSDKLWEAYIGWETDLKNLTTIYDRVLATPTQMYAQHFENFSKHVKQNHPREILSLDEFLKIRQQVVKKKTPVDAVDAEAPPGEDTESEKAEAPPGESPPGDDDAKAGESITPPGEEKAEAASDDKPPGLESSETEDEAEIAAIKDKVIELRQAVHKLNETEVGRRWSFEEGIRRPYFHVKPLEKVQIKNWRDYLDFEMEFGAHDRIIVLFERCLIACALYEEFWMKYTRYLQSQGADAVRDVYRRACLIHLKKKPTIHLAWAAFEERQGDLSAAQEVLTTLDMEVPKLAMVGLRQISLERRQGHFDKVDDLYKRFIAEADTDKDRTYYAIKFARYQAKVLRNLAAARETLNSALEKDEANPKLYLQLIDLEYQQADVDEPRLLEVFQKVLTSSLSSEQKQSFSQRKLEYLEDFCNNITKVQEAYEEHQKLLKELNVSGSKKRKAETSTAAEDSSQTDKKPKTDNGYVANGTSTDQNVDYSQWGYGNTQQQQQQQQQWNQSYNQNMPYQYNPWAPYSSTYY